MKKQTELHNLRVGDSFQLVGETLLIVIKVNVRAMLDICDLVGSSWPLHEMCYFVLSWRDC